MTTKLIGGDAGTGDTGDQSNDFVILTRYQCIASGNLTEIRVKTSNTGYTVTAALYTDVAGVPGSIIVKNETGVASLNDDWAVIPITPTPLTLDTYYWLAVQYPANLGWFYYSSGGTTRWWKKSTLPFPDPFNGAGWTTDSYGSDITGYGTLAAGRSRGYIIG